MLQLGKTPRTVPLVDMRRPYSISKIEGRLTATLFITMNRRQFVLALAASFATSARAQSGGAAFSEAQKENISTRLEHLVFEHRLPGLVVGVTKGGQRQIFCFGVPDIKHSEPISSETIFEIGSISKLFTGIVAGYAVDRGMITLDDLVSMHVPALAGTRVGQIKLLNLGTYTAGGLPLQFPNGIASTEEALAYLASWQPSAPPGAVRRYSNPSIGLFGHAASAALGADFKQVLQSAILPGLGLSNTSIDVPNEAEGRYAWGYDDKDLPVRVNPGPFDAEAYGVKTTATDMLRLIELTMQSHLAETWIQHAIDMAQIARFAIGPMRQGLGWELYDWPTSLDNLLEGNSRSMILDAREALPVTRNQVLPGPVLLNKTGSTNGFGAYVMCVPDRQLGLVLLANRNFPIPARVRAGLSVLEIMA